MDDNKELQEVLIRVESEILRYLEGQLKKILPFGVSHFLVAMEWWEEIKKILMKAQKG